MTGEPPPMDLHDRLDDAIRDQDVDSVRALLRAHPDLANGPDGVTTPPLQIAIGVTGDSRIVAALLDHGADTESVCRDTGSTPLKYAVVFTRPNLIPLLVERGADVNNRGNGSSPLQLAEKLPTDELRDMGVTGTREQYREIAELLRRLGARR